MVDYEVRSEVFSGDTLIIISIKGLFTAKDIKPIAAKFASTAAEIDESQGFHLLCEILESQIVTEDVLDVLYETTFSGKTKHKLGRCAFVVDNSATRSRINSCLRKHGVESIGIFTNKGKAMKELLE
jgi:hypothetical protein